MTRVIFCFSPRSAAGHAVGDIPGGLPRQGTHVGLHQLKSLAARCDGHDSSLVLSLKADGESVQTDLRSEPA